nr:tripartite motif-containing protein 3-like [Lytechinus pictus]
MAEKFIEALSDHVECGICSCPYESAKYLDCLHTFCEGCINRLLDQTNQVWNGPSVCIRCPICRKVTRFQAGRKADTLKSNFIVNGIVEELLHHDLPGPVVEQKEDVCADHGIETKFYCEKCNKIICSECALCKHYGHTFLIKNVEDASKSKAKEINNLISNATSWLQSHRNFSKEYGEKRAEGNKRLDEIKEAITTSYSTNIDTITNKLEAKKEALMAEVVTRREEFVQVLDGVLVPLAEAMSQVLDDVEFGEALVDTNDHREILLNYQDWMKSLCNRLDYGLPSSTAAKKQISLIESMCFRRSANSIIDVPKLGTVWYQKKDQHDQHAQGESILNPVIKLNRPTERLLLTERGQLSGEPEMMTPYPNGRILVLYKDRRVEILSPDGNIDNVRPIVSARYVAALSDGRIVALSDRNTVNIYNQQGQRQEVMFQISACDEFAEYIATDKDNHVYVLYPRAAKFLKFPTEGGEPTAVIPLATDDLRDVSSMGLSKEGNVILVLAQGEVRVFSSTGRLIRRIPIKEADRVSCDQEGKLWIIANQDIQGSNRAFLEVYSEYGLRRADCYIPKDPATSTSEFEPWGVALSPTCYAACVSPTEIAWFVHEVDR